MEEPQTHYFQVKIRVGEFKDKLSDSGTLRLKMPVWTPGSYLIREFARNIPEVVAYRADSGKSQLKCEKITKSEWTVETKGASEIEIEYRVYAFEFTVDTSYMDNLHAIVNGASVFLYVDGMEGEPGTLEIIPFKWWRDISTGLEKVPGTDRVFLFPNYDILVDSPLEVGNLDLRNFQLGKTHYEVSIFSMAEFDRDQFVSDLKKIVESTEKVFDDIPFSRYVFMVEFMSDNSFGGLEHLNSTQCIAPVVRLQPPQEYHKLLSLFSHEFFHAWNVKRMRPLGLGPFDYSKEAYTKSLWIAEGITSYYDDFLIRKAGIYTIAEYLDAISENISLMKTLPGSRWQSAQESSFDSWIKYYRQNENSPNTIFSYYTQGSVIGWMLDTEIRKSTNLTKTLDDAMRKTYSDTYKARGTGYSDEEFERACLQVSGNSHAVKQIFDERVKGRRDVDYDRYLGYSGLKLVPKKVEAGAGFLGIRVKDDSGRTVVVTVLASSAAENASVSANDEILGINGIRMDKSKLAYYVPGLKPGEEVSLSVARQGAMIELQGRLSEKPPLEYRIEKKSEASEDERKFFASWLGGPWTGEIKYEESRSPPWRLNPLDYI